MKEIPKPEKLFKLGGVLIDSQAIHVLYKHGLSKYDLLTRHQLGDTGELKGLFDPNKEFHSVFRFDGQNIHVITTEDRSATRIFLETPEPVEARELETISADDVGTIPADLLK